ncbi:MAG TPA: hypothetical protein PKV16_02160 [Caldisericia bacterium]|nr:hypothetical protein [Caldisericia bacterium]HPF48117.1 hypothetical protein [Caldisericia bacterium]HPI83946.1 hypothetical protein [Caldisericia bacterium]HPQ92570.1 hypothetical protein [Caldisericia bacterium]HRV74332.1 hypothetical protein [Caldisericia bacterium]
MKPTTERELKLDLSVEFTNDLIEQMPKIFEKNGWDCPTRINMTNFDRYFDKLLDTGNFLLHSNNSYVRVRKSVWPEKKREAEFIAYRKLTEAAYGKPAEIYDYEISVLKTQEITHELLMDYPSELREPFEEAIGSVEHLESMRLSEIVRLRCDRVIWPIKVGLADTDVIKIKIDRVVYKSHPMQAFAQIEIDYYSPSLFDKAAAFVRTLSTFEQSHAGASTMSKLDRGLSLL